jgi:import inner membrane translocase subunit TIM23
MSHQQKHSDDTEVFSGNDFGEKVAFTVGSSFCTGFLLGIGKGLKTGYPKSFKMPKKLIINNFFNALGKETSKLGNAFAAAGLMYYFVGAALNLFFED